MIRVHLSSVALLAGLMSAPALSRTASQCHNEWPSPTNFDPKTHDWEKATHAISEAYTACLKKEGEERDREFAERKAAREEEDRRQQAVSNALRNAGTRGISMSDAISIAKSTANKVGERITSAIVSAPGNRALGVGGPRDGVADKVGRLAVDAADRAGQSNGIAAKLSGIATRSAVDVNSRAMGSLQAGLDNFSQADGRGPRPSDQHQSGFAHLPSAVPATKPVGFSSVRISGAVATRYNGPLSASAASGQTLTDWRTGSGASSSADFSSSSTSPSRALEAIQSRQAAEGTRVHQAYEERRAAQAERRRLDRIRTEEAAADFERQRAEAASLAQAQFEAERERQLAASEAYLCSVGACLSYYGPGGKYYKGPRPNSPSSSHSRSYRPSDAQPSQRSPVIESGRSSETDCDRYIRSVGLARAYADEANKAETARYCGQGHFPGGSIK